jgi:diaminohydroxyphosphoribosylaminopyrimidine deaminase/5-amino-6-(5-phosphoribosylamino)uracil reductase
LVESGAGLSSAFIYGGWVDELMVYIAPKLMGADAMPLVAKTGLASMDELMGFETTAVERLGNDIKVTMVPS